MALPAKPPRKLFRRRKRASKGHTPLPPIELPPGRVAQISGRGELFYRDTGGDGPVVLLLHGWVVSADLNWFLAYGPLSAAGYRVIALDHRGHGRGLRPLDPFRLVDCAADAAALLAHLGVERATAVGYSLGGPIASLLARDHGDRVSGLVLCATAPHWQSRSMKWIWRAQGAVRLAGGIFPRGIWRAGFRLAGFPETPAADWFISELTRGSGVDMAEAGRELGRYDARPWLPGIDVPAAVIVTTHDKSVPPHTQRELVPLLRAREFDVKGDHDAVTTKAERFNKVLLEAIRSTESSPG